MLGLSATFNFLHTCAQFLPQPPVSLGTALNPQIHILYPRVIGVQSLRTIQVEPTLELILKNVRFESHITKWLVTNINAWPYLRQPQNN